MDYNELCKFLKSGTTLKLYDFIELTRFSINGKNYMIATFLMYGDYKPSYGITATKPIPLLLELGELSNKAFQSACNQLKKEGV